MSWQRTKPMGLSQKDVSVQVNHYRFYRLSYLSYLWLPSDLSWYHTYDIFTSRQLSFKNKFNTLKGTFFFLRGCASFIQGQESRPTLSRVQCFEHAQNTRFVFSARIAEFRCWPRPPPSASRFLQLTKTSRIATKIQFSNILAKTSRGETQIYFTNNTVKVNLFSFTL